MQNIFVSYRREDSSDVTGRIFDHLRTAFGEEHLFKDVDSIPLGTDFREVISAAVQKCDVLLVVIGEKWLEVKDETGGRRIDNPDDYVRLEISSALDRNIPVIPVLVGRATIPTQESLPAPLQRLAFRNALYVRPDPDFHNDIERLRRDLGRFLKLPDPAKKRESRTQRMVMITTAAVVGVIVLAAIFLALRPPPSISGDTVNTMTVTNVAIILQEYEKYQGKPLLDNQLKEQIDRAVATAREGKHRESVQLLEKISEKVPVPAVFTNLGIEYAKLNDPDAARSAFAKAMDKDPGYEAARVNRALLENSLTKAADTSSSGATTQAGGAMTKAISFEKSPASAMVIDRLEGHAGAIEQIHVVEGGTKLGGMYNIKYSLTADTPTLVDPGTYDVLFKTAGGGTFVVAEGIAVKDGERTRINPNPMLGSIRVDPLTRNGFPAIKQVSVFEAGTTGYRLILQRTDKLGVALPIVPGRYDIRAETTDGSEFVLIEGVEVKARQVAHVQTDSEVAAFVVHDPKMSGVQVEAIYVLRAGGNEIIAQTQKFDHPMMVPPDGSYDIAIKQPGGLARLKTKVTAKRGELTEIP
jgi:TIR domain